MNKLKYEDEVQSTHPALSEDRRVYAADQIAMELIHGRESKRSLVNLIRWLIVDHAKTVNQELLEMTEGPTYMLECVVGPVVRSELLTVIGDAYLRSAAKDAFHSLFDEWADMIGSGFGHDINGKLRSYDELYGKSGPSDIDEYWKCSIGPTPSSVLVPERVEEMFEAKVSEA